MLPSSKAYLRKSAIRIWPAGTSNTEKIQEEQNEIQKVGTKIEIKIGDFKGNLFEDLLIRLLQIELKNLHVIMDLGKKTKQIKVNLGSVHVKNCDGLFLKRGIWTLLWVGATQRPRINIETQQEEQVNSEEDQHFEDEQVSKSFMSYDLSEHLSKATSSKNLSKKAQSRSKSPITLTKKSQFYESNKSSTDKNLVEQVEEIGSPSILDNGSISHKIKSKKSKNEEERLGMLLSVVMFTKNLKLDMNMNNCVLFYDREYIERLIVLLQNFLLYNSNTNKTTKPEEKPEVFVDRNQEITESRNISGDTSKESLSSLNDSQTTPSGSISSGDGGKFKRIPTIPDKKVTKSSFKLDLKLKFSRLGVVLKQNSACIFD